MYNHKSILVVQDDERVVNIIKQSIALYYDLTIKRDINNALSILEKKHFDIVILNTKCHSGSTLEVSRRIKMESDAKIIFLSSTNNIDIKEKCFQSGADDFITMPFFPKELLIRIKNILHEYDNNFKYTVEKKGIQLYLNTKAVKLNNCLVYLSPTEFMVLEYLLLHDTVKKGECILRYLNTRKNQNCGYNSLIVCINRLRNKLEKGTGMEIIKTRYGSGYYIAT